MDSALTVLAAALILLPGWALWLRLAGPQPTQETAISGLSFALALAMLVLYVVAHASLAAFVVVWAVAVAVACARLIGRPPRFPVDRTLALLALGAAAVRFLPALLQDYPPGWDPNFHLLVIRLIEQKGALVATLSPFEDIPINYPTGSHLMVALVAKVTGASVYSVFQVVLALFGSLSCLQVYALAHAATENRRWALYAMVAYAFLAWAGLGYYEWGGLPNLLGMYLLAGCLTVVMQREAGERRWWVLPIMWCAIALSNHHVLMAAFGVMLAVLCSLALQPARRADAKSLLSGACVAAAFAAPRLAYQFAPRQQSIHETGLLLYGEPEITLWSLLGHTGAVFLVAVVAGLVLYGRDPQRRALRRELLLAGAVLACLFVLFEYGGRFVMLAVYQRPISPFTPSRFLTDAAYPLSVFAGLALLEIERWLRRWTMPAACLLFLTHAPAYAKQFAPAVDANRRAAYLWVAANTRPDTLVIDPWVQAPVLTGRASSHTALPSSELWARASKRKLLQRISSGQTPVASARAPVILITYGQEPLVPPERILLRHGYGYVVDLNPKLSARLRARR